MEFVSDGCEALTGYKAADLVGIGARTYNSLIHPDDRDRIWNEVQESVSKRLPFRLTYRIVAADGRERSVWEQGVGVFSGTELTALEGFISRVGERATPCECDPLSPRRTGQADFPASGSPENVSP
jgi:PAS domain-containing protein